MSIYRTPATLLIGALCIACASESPSQSNKPDASSEDTLDQTETALPDGIPEESGHFTHRGRASVIETVVDAQSEEEWRQLDLDTGEETDDKDAWDLAFSRSRIRINGGISGPGAVSVATLTEAFDAVSDIPADDALRPEEPDSEGDKGDADSEPDNAFYSSGDDWFAYNTTTHELTPRDVTFVVKSSAARYYKLRFLRYYDASNGSPAVLTLRWIELASE
jgi:hypothetical protein